MKNQIKKVLTDKNLYIQHLEKQVDDYIKFNNQLQETCQNKDTEIAELEKEKVLYGDAIRSSMQSSIDRITQISIERKTELRKIKAMNLFQLSAWWLKRELHQVDIIMKTGLLPK